jgi:cytochrome c biogenesis factor
MPIDRAKRVRANVKIGIVNSAHSFLVHTIMHYFIALFLTFLIVQVIALHLTVAKVGELGCSVDTECKNKGQRKS